MRPLAAALVLAGIGSAAHAGAAEPGEGSASRPVTVAALIAEQGVHQGRPVAWWTREGPGAAGRAAKPERTAEAALMSAWRAGGFVFVPLDPLSPRLAAERIGAGDLSAAQARAAGRISGAALVVHGTAVAMTEDTSSGAMERAASSTGFKPLVRRTCVATVALRAHRADTGEVLGEAESTLRSSEPNPIACGRSAIEKAGREAAESLRTRVQATWPLASLGRP